MRMSQHKDSMQGPVTSIDQLAQEINQSLRIEKEHQPVDGPMSV